MVHARKQKSTAVILSGTDSNQSSNEEIIDEHILDSKKKSSSDSDVSFSKKKIMNASKRLRRNGGKKLTSAYTENTSESDKNDSDYEDASQKQSKATKNKKKRKLVRESEQSSESDNEDSTAKTPKRAKKRTTKRSKKKKIKEESPTKGRLGRKEIRSVLKKGQLTEETKDAEKQERERIKRLEKSKVNTTLKVDLGQAVDGTASASNKIQLVLQKEPLVEVDEHITQHLKPHQVEGIQFIWDNLIESTEQVSSSEGGGCILAHCMGLGKTLQTISVLHTILTHDSLSFKTVLIVAPVNTLLNWRDEFHRWLPDGRKLKLHSLSDQLITRDRVKALNEWHKVGGVLIIGYDMFRLLASGARIKYKKWRLQFAEFLLDPGPDIIVCDEGHRLKNSEANISVVMSKVKTKRRLVLTGTPLQNNLMEYQCMVNFVKPNLLGSVKEFRNRFVNPIQNGQHSDSTPMDVRLMKKRCHVLHEMLHGFVQRKDYTALAKYLCNKLEFIIKVRMTPLQVKLYRAYLDTQTNRGSNPDAVIYGSRDTGLFADYQNLMRVWTHPRVLRLHKIRQDNAGDFVNDLTSEEAESSGDENLYGGESEEEDNHKKAESPIVNGHVIKGSDDVTEQEAATNPLRKKKLTAGDDVDAPDDDNDDVSDDAESFDDEDSSDDGSSDEEVKTIKRTRSRGRYGLRRMQGDGDEEEEQEEEPPPVKQSVDENLWYSSIFQEHEEELNDIEAGGKLSVLFEILHLAKQCDDKVLVFSQSLLSLDLIEEMLALSTAKLASMEELGQNPDESMYQKWFKDVDYFRIDGASVGKARQKWINRFNDEDDRRGRLFLISTKAGSLGINLVAANRVVIFDVSWNPSHDVQSIFRVYRFGQNKPCFIYRLIAQGTMEEKIYDRQVTKQSLSFRVIDEQQINRYFTAHDLQELYNFTPSPPIKEGDPETTHALPKDKLLAELLVGGRTKHLISSYHQHDSLLDHQETEELTEEERKIAWEEYEKEKTGQHLKPPLPTASLDLAKRLELHYQQRQLLMRQQQHNLMPKEKGSGASSSLFAQIAGFTSSANQPNNRDGVFSMMLKVSESIAACRKKIEQNRPINIDQTIVELRKMAMYSRMKEESLRLIAFEVKLRRHQLQTAAENELKRLFIQMRWLNAKHQEFVATQKLSATSTASTSADQSASPPISMEEASTFARSSFFDMIKGLNSTKAEKNEVSATENPPGGDGEQSSLPKTKKKAPESVSTENLSGSTTSTPESGLASGSNLKINPVPSRAPDRTSSSTKPLKPLAIKPSSKGGKRKQVFRNISDEEDSSEEETSEEEEDWEAEYLKKSKTRIRRSRT